MALTGISPHVLTGPLRTWVLWEVKVPLYGLYEVLYDLYMTVYTRSIRDTSSADPYCFCDHLSMEEDDLFPRASSSIHPSCTTLEAAIMGTDTERKAGIKELEFGGSISIPALGHLQALCNHLASKHQHQRLG